MTASPSTLASRRLAARQHPTAAAIFTAIAGGALGEGAGFGTGTKALVVVACAILFVGLLEAVRTLVASPGEQTAAKTAAGGVAAASGRLR